MKEEINVRLAQTEDIPLIVSVMREGFSYIIDKTIYGCKGIDKYIGDNLTDPSYYYFIVEKSEVFAGAIEFRIFGSTAFLNYIVLKENIRGKGLACEIFEKSLTMLPNFTKIELDVFSGNTRALNWYIKMGFSIIGHNYWNEIKIDKSFSHEGIYEEINTDINLIKFDRYGFSVFEFGYDGKKYATGVMGDKHIRITDRNIISNMDLFAYVLSRYPNRTFFSILDKEITGNDYFTLNPIIDSYRMIKKNDENIK